MTNDKIEILRDLKFALSNRLNDNLVDVVLFGSQLTDNKTDSDFDILIIVKNKTDWRLEREISDICFDIDLKFGILTDTHILSHDDLNSPRGRQPIFKNAIKQGFHAWLMIKFGKILRNAFQNRTKGDYDAFVSFEKDEVLQMHKEMIEFINEIKRLIEI